MTNYICKSCGRRCLKRTEFLVHTSVCNKFGCLRDEEEKLSESEVDDDTDADSTYSPGSEDAPYSSDSRQSSLVDLSSPVTKEEAITADLAEPYLMPDFLEEDNAFRDELLLPTNSEDTSSLNGIELLPQNIDLKDDLFSNKTVLSNKPLSKIRSPLLNENSPNDQRKSSKPNKLTELQERINIWKLKRKEALKNGRKSMVKRISRNIKKSENEILKETFETSEKTEVTVKKHGRKKNYCKYCDKLVTKFCEHVESRHKDTVEGSKLALVDGDQKTKRILKTKMTSAIRKEWNAVYNKKVSIENLTQEAKKPTILVKKLHKSNSKTVSCAHCYGVYRRDKLKVHLRRCEKYNIHDHQSSSSKPLKCLKEHSLTESPHLQLVTPEFHSAILNGIQFDEVIAVALEDSLIMKFSSDFHKSRREQNSKSYVIREMRDLTKLYINVKNDNQDIKSFEDCINPKYFSNVINAALQLAKYNPVNGVVGVPSIAYRLSQPIKDAANLLLNEELAKYHSQQNCSDRSKITKIQDFLYLMDNQWKIQIGRISRKVNKYKQAEKQALMALEEDIVKLAEYIQHQYKKLLSDLNNPENLKMMAAYDMLMHALVSHIMLLGRRRPVDFKNATIKHYSTIDRDDSFLEMAGNKFNPDEIKLCNNFHVFMVPGKNLEPVPMVLTPSMKKVLETLLNKRLNVGINEKNDVLFLLSNEKFINPVESLRIMKNKVKLKKPNHLTGNGLRHQAATFSRLHSSHPQYQDFLASALGHSLAVHRKHYQIPLGVLHKLNVYPVLHNIMTGESQSKEVSSQELLITGGSNHSDTTQNEVLSEPSVSYPSNEGCIDRQSDDSSYSEPACSPIKRKHRWTEEEQAAVLTEFGQNILQKQCPPRSEIVRFKNCQEQLFKHLSISQIQMYVRNHVLRSQKNVTPKVKRFLKSKNPY